jgi:hypothetical protein
MAAASGGWQRCALDRSREHIRIREPANPKLGTRKVYRALAPDGQPVHPDVSCLGAVQGYLLEQRERASSPGGDRDPCADERQTGAVIGTDTRVEVQVKAPIGTNREIVHAYDGSIEARPCDRAAEAHVEPDATWWKWCSRRKRRQGVAELNDLIDMQVGVI